MAEKWYSKLLKAIVNPTTAMSYLNNGWQDGYEALFGYNDPEDGFISLNDVNKYTDQLLLTQREQNKIAQQYNSAEAAAARQFNAQEAQKARAWSERMSNTAYQRAMADMKAAGLNPILAYQQGGATSFGGASASGMSANISNAGGDTAADIIPAILDLIAELVGGFF